MNHELREYLFLPQQWPEYRRLLVEVARRIRGDRFGILIGAWEAAQQASGGIRFVHLWQCDSLDARTALRKELAQVAEWSSEFLPVAVPLIHSQSPSILHPRSGTDALRHFASNGGYLHRASAFVGQAASVVARASGEGICCWTTEFADPNGVAWFKKSEPSDAAVESVRSLRTLRLKPLDPSNPIFLA